MVINVDDPLALESRIDLIQEDLKLPKTAKILLEKASGYGIYSAISTLQTTLIYFGHNPYLKSYEIGILEKKTYKALTEMINEYGSEKTDIMVSANLINL